MRFVTFVALALLCTMIGLAAPATANDLTVDLLTAAQYSYGYFIAYITAHGSQQILDAHLLVNGVPVVPDRVDRNIFGPSNNFGIWTIYKYANGVARPGDVVSAVVTDIGLDTARKDVVCTAPSKRKTDQTAICQ